MNKYLIIIFLILSYSAIGQKKLDGTFIIGNNLNYKAFTFYKNGTFLFSNSEAAFYFIEGKGKYTIKDEKIKLRFIGFEPLNNSYTIKKKNCDNSDKESLTLTVIDKEFQKPLSGASIELKLKYSQKIIDQIQTDENGVVAINRKISEEFRDSTIIITAIFYNDYDEHSKAYSFDFKLTTCKQIDIALVLEPHSFNQKVADGEVWEYKLKNFKDEKGEGIIFQKLPSPLDTKISEEIFYKIKNKK